MGNAVIDPIHFYEALKENGITFFTGVPDSLLKHMCACIADRVPPKQHLIAHNEGGSIGLAAGHYLATGNPALVYMQNSGQGNAMNPLVSLAAPEVYGIPMVLLVGWRGEPGRKDEPQHCKQGSITPALFDAMDIPCSVLPSEKTACFACLKDAIAQCQTLKQPVALLVRADTFSTYEANRDPAPERMNREDVIARILESLPPESGVVSTTGHISREVYEHRVRSQSGHEHDFLTVGSMGHASQIALGIALNQPQRPIVCLDGDGAALMHMGALPVIGTNAGSNYLHILLNNGAHGSVGGQPTVGLDIELVEIAQACNYCFAHKVESMDAIKQTLHEALSASGPAFLEICVGTAARKSLARPATSPSENKQRFMHFLQS